MPLTILVSGRKLTLTGDLDRDVCDQLQSSLTSLKDGHVVIDMANVDHVDEAGLGVLVSEARRRSGHGGTVTVTNPSSSLCRQLQTRALLDFLRVDQTSPPDPENEEDDRNVDLSELASPPTPVVQQINSSHGRQGYRLPVEHIGAQLGPEELATLYRVADCLVVTPYADGMNLVAKEFVASRGDLDGTLLLSEFAGAAEHLSGALIVNPYDLDAIKHSMLTARTMSKAERRSRMATMRAEVRAHDLHTWARSFLGRLTRIDQHRESQDDPRVAAISGSVAAMAT